MKTRFPANSASLISQSLSRYDERFVLHVTTSVGRLW